MKNQTESRKVSGQRRWHVVPALLSLAILQNCSQDTSFSETTPSNADVIAGKYRPLDTGSSQMEEGVLSIAPYTAPSQTFSLVNKYTNVNVVQAGADRRYTETFFQGARGVHKVEEFNLMAPPKLDLLLMVDDSSSMDSYKAELGNKMESLLGHISNTNWRIGVITTTESCLNTLPKLTNANQADENTVYYLDKAMYEADPEATKARFKTLVQQKGFRASPNEQGIKTVVDALTGADARCQSISGKSSNFWMREGATKSVIMVTDERNCGTATGDNCYTLDAEGSETKADDLPWSKSDYFTTNENISKMNVTVHGLFLLARVKTYAEQGLPVDNSDPCLGSQGAFKQPVEYMKLVNREGRKGKFADVCADFDKYDTVLSGISETMKQQVVKAYTVSQVPTKEADAIKVTVNGERFFDFVVNGSTVTFTKDLTETEGTVRIDYYGLPEHQKDRFDLVTASLSTLTNIEVKLNDAVVTDDKYTYIATDSVRGIKFNDFPPYGAKVEISYNDPLLHNTFAYEGKIMAGTLVVKVDGVIKTDVVFDNDKGIMTTKNIGLEYDTTNGRDGVPLAGSRISMTYNKIGERKAVYESDIKHKDGIRFKLEDITTGATLDASFTAGGIEVANEDLIHDRKVKATFDDTLDEQNDQRVSLQFANVPYTMTAMKVDSSKLPKECLERLTISDKGLKLICNNDALEEKVDIPYSFPIDYKNAFDVTQTTKIIDEYTKFYIEVNGKEITTDDYKLSGKKIVIDRSKLPVAAKVYIKALN